MTKLEWVKVALFKIMLLEVRLLDKMVFNGQMVIQTWELPRFLLRWVFH